METHFHLCCALWVLIMAKRIVELSDKADSRHKKSHSESDNIIKAK